MLFCLEIDWIMLQCSSFIGIDSGSTRFTDDAELFMSDPSNWSVARLSFDVAARTMGLYTSDLKQLMSRVRKWMQLPVSPTSEVIWTPVDTAHLRSSDALASHLPTLSSVWRKQQRVSLQTKLRIYRSYFQFSSLDRYKVLTRGLFSDPTPVTTGIQHAVPATNR